MHRSQDDLELDRPRDIGRRWAPEDSARVIQENIPVLVSTVRRAPHRPVEAYPGWLVQDLAAHVLAVYRRTIDVLRTGTLARPAHRTTRRPLPADPAGELAATADELVEAFSGCMVLPMGMGGSDISPRFWIRRMAFETLLHAWDAEAAIGRERQIPESVAQDAIDEFVDVQVRERLRGHATTVRSHVGLIARRPGTRRWWLELGPAGLRPSAVPPSDGAVEGRLVADPGWLWLWLNRRVPRPPQRGDHRPVDALERALDGRCSQSPAATAWEQVIASADRGPIEPAR